LICLALFWLLHDSMCYFIVLMSLLLFYDVENSKDKEKSLNELVFLNFWPVVYNNGVPVSLTCCPSLPNVNWKHGFDSAYTNVSYEYINMLFLWLGNMLRISEMYLVLANMLHRFRKRLQKLEMQKVAHLNRIHPTICSTAFIYLFNCL
jgi:amino acid transporter